MDPKIKFLQDDKRKKAGKYVPINAWNATKEIPNQNPPDEITTIENDESASCNGNFEDMKDYDDYFDE